MIGGAMLACAVLAMVVIAGWSLARDDLSEARAQDGLLALRSWGEARVQEKAVRRGHASSRKEAKAPRKARPEDRRAKRRHASEGGMDFDRDEMAMIAEEVAEKPVFKPRPERR